ncbi:MAG TPA: hypothetical protein VF194_15850 [Ferrovibrio sp.]|uniref:hypothetical protein n=1 Tax=Ferrovibrio sp. TaxID=1917215 RepID=UPI002ED0D05E
MADNAAQIIALGRLVGAFGRDVDHGDFVALGRQLPRNRRADKAGAADDDFHGKLPDTSGRAIAVQVDDAQSLQFAMQR